jgi:hypothetical protein
MSNKAVSVVAKCAKSKLIKFRHLPRRVGREKCLLNPHRLIGESLITLSSSPRESLITFCHRAFLVRAVLIRGSYIYYI